MYVLLWAQEHLIIQKTKAWILGEQRFVFFEMQFKKAGFHFYRAQDSTHKKETKIDKINTFNFGESLSFFVLVF